MAAAASASPARLAGCVLAATGEPSRTSRLSWTAWPWVLAWFAVMTVVVALAWWRWGRSARPAPGPGPGGGGDGLRPFTRPPAVLLAAVHPHRIPALAFGVTVLDLARRGQLHVTDRRWGAGPGFDGGLAEQAAAPTLADGAWHLPYPAGVSDPFSPASPSPVAEPGFGAPAGAGDAGDPPPTAPSLSRLFVAALKAPANQRFRAAHVVEWVVEPGPQALGVPPAAPGGARPSAQGAGLAPFERLAIDLVRAHVADLARRGRELSQWSVPAKADQARWKAFVAAVRAEPDVVGSWRGRGVAQVVVPLGAALGTLAVSLVLVTLQQGWGLVLGVLAPLLAAPLWLLFRAPFSASGARLAQDVALRRAVLSSRVAEIPAGPGDVDLWERSLVEAVAFGVDQEFLAGLAERAPSLGHPAAGFAPWFRVEPPLPAGRFADLDRLGPGAVVYGADVAMRFTSGWGFRFPSTQGVLAARMRLGAAPGRSRGRRSGR